jgi:hypothetical protein
MRARTVVLLVAGLNVSAVVLAQVPRRDGKWEVTTEMDMPGMPMKMPPMVATQCVTKEEADDPQKAVPKGGGGRGDDSKCKVSDYKVAGNKVTWTVKCEGEQAMTAKGEIEYTEDTYKGTQTMDMGGRGTMTMKMSAKRLGDCTK